MYAIMSSEICCAVMSCDLNHMHALRVSISDVTLVQYTHLGTECAQ